MLVWWFVGVQPCFNALIEDHVPVVADVADTPEPWYNGTRASDGDAD